MKRDFSVATRQLAQSRQGRGAKPAAHIADVQAQIEAIARGDFAGAISHAWEGVELDIFAPPEFRWISRARGRHELEEALQHNFDSVEDQRPEIMNVLTQGDLVVLIGQERGRIRRTGEAYHVEFVHRFTFREGRLASVRIIAATVL